MHRMRMFSQPWARHVAMWTAVSLIVGAQRVNTNINSGASFAAAAITAVKPENTVVTYLGSESGSVQQADSTFVRVLLNGTSSLSFDRGGSPAVTITVNAEVLEFVPGIIKSIQRGTVTISATPATQAITAVDMAKTSLHLLGFSHSSATATLTLVPRIRLSAANTVTANAQTLGSICAYQAVEWN